MIDNSADSQHERQPDQAELTAEQDQQWEVDRVQAYTKLQELNFRLPLLEDPQNGKREKYDTQDEWSWVGWMLTRQDAVTDERLYRYFGESQVEAKNARPDEEPDPRCDFSASSWNYITREAFKKHWREDRAELVQIINDEETPPEEMVDKLENFKNKIFARSRAMAESYFDQLEQYGVRKETVVACGSGADAIVMAKKLLIGSEAIGVSTSENGSGVYDILPQDAPSPDGKAVSKDSNAIFLRDEKGNPYPDDVIYAAYIEQIQKGGRFVSLTAVSKTGLRYDQQSEAVQTNQYSQVESAQMPAGVIERVLEYIQQHNEDPANAQDQIIAIIDVVQVVGRHELVNAFKWMKHPAVKGLVHTGSKGAGAIAHGGFFTPTAPGAELIQHRLDTQQIDAKKLQKDCNIHQVGYASQLEAKGINTKRDVMAAYRIEDNTDALSDVLADTAEVIPRPENENAESYIELTAKLHELYAHFFITLGFKMVRSDMISLFGMHLPDGISPTAMASTLLPTLARAGVAFGGPLSEARKGEKPLYPIMRGALSPHLLREMKAGKPGHSLQDIANFVYGSDYTFLRNLYTRNGQLPDNDPGSEYLSQAFGRIKNKGNEDPKADYHKAELMMEVGKEIQYFIDEEVIALREKGAKQRRKRLEEIYDMGLEADGKRGLISLFATAIIEARLASL